MLAVKGTIQGDKVIIDDEDIGAYDGRDVIVTILDYPYEKRNKKSIDWDSYVMPSDRGKDIDEYMRDMRENDRL